MENASPPQASPRLPSLDGWRALSIALVLGSHCINLTNFPVAWQPAFQWIFPGVLGVRMFFVISGFLITWLLLAEHDRTGRVSLRGFYIRRALRLLPVYFAYLFVLALLQVFTPYWQSPRSWLGNLTFTTNFILPENWSSIHLWSLAVEEQFYLVWPLLFVLVGGGRSLRKSLWLLAPALCIAPLARVLTYTGAITSPIGFLFTTFSFFNFFDSLAIGCGCAFLMARMPDKIAGWTTRRQWVVFSVGLLLLVGPHVLTSLLLCAIFTVPLGQTCQGLGFALLLLQSLHAPRFGPYRLLNQRAVCFFGTLSYSIYIWQQIFSNEARTFGLGPVWWMSFPTWIFAALLVAAVSYYGLERPLFRLRARFRA